MVRLNQKLVFIVNIKLFRRLRKSANTSQIPFSKLV